MGISSSVMSNFAKKKFPQNLANFGTKREEKAEALKLKMKRKEKESCPSHDGLNHWDHNRAELGFGER